MERFTPLLLVSFVPSHGPNYSFYFSFVRSVTMDKWKDSELEKMKVGGNRKATEFFNSQSDYKPGMSLQEKYNSRAAALYRDKVLASMIHSLRYSPEVIKLFSCSSQLSMKFQLLITNKLLKNKGFFFACKLSDILVIMLINNFWQPHFNIYEHD